MHINNIVIIRTPVIIINGIVPLVVKYTVVDANYTIRPY